MPVLPRFPAGLPGTGRSTRYRSGFLEGRCASYSLGRYALTAVLKSVGVGPSSSVLIPAYHCRTMIDPVLRLGGTPVLFALRPDLSPDWERLDASATAAERPLALLLPHFFGFPQQADRVRSWCDRHRIAYIEDCSHALFGEFEGRPIGTLGDYAIASPYKFFASEDGGWARAADGNIAPGGELPALRDELRGIWHSMEAARQRVGRTLRPELPVEEAPCWRDEIRDEAGTSIQYDARAEGRQALRWSRLVLRLSSVDRIARVRRRNYQVWLDAVAGLEGCRPMFPVLPETVVPYMFPLWLDEPEPVFVRLKRAGMPIFRWDELAVGDCEVSRAARLGLFHLPCHQGVGPVEMDWMVGLLRQALARA